MTATPHLPRLAQLPPGRRRLLAVVAVVVAVLALSVPLGIKALHGAASSGASSSGASAGEASRGAVTGSGVVGPDVAPAPDATAGAKSPASDTGSLGSGVAGSVAVVEPKIARSAWLGIKVTDLTGSAARVRVIATDAGGQVTSENVVTSVDPTGGPTGPGGVDPRLESGSSVPSVGVDEARMVLSVPAKALDTVLTQLSRIGTVSYRSSQSQDVTDTYVDTKARIEPMQDGINRVRALLTKTTDLQQVILLESELTRRQAELDSLTQRLAQLDAMTTMSDVTVTLWTDATTPVQTESGLGSGLRTAWESFLGSLTVILTGLAALLPWLVLLVPLTLLGLRLWRRHTAGMPSATSHGAGAAGAAPAAQPAGGPAAASAGPTPGPTPGTTPGPTSSD
ncbi:DUF4349 domain-containing protein [Terrabacter sp. Root181]|uniref:DUF4349 domain-containing protein n=1 Tax=Terrabacter sp. Root181 TaxID=1736484 RepID=UPI0006FED378|nr:DUF4349 domain-containing protein [Terrabacter sp. Root181]KRB44876.1 hypothetical protein ASD90_14260 [Terrabacter sp. Root181]